jgi:hypothetical protein
MQVEHRNHQPREKRVTRYDQSSPRLLEKRQQESSGNEDAAEKRRFTDRELRSDCPPAPRRAVASPLAGRAACKAAAMPAEKYAARIDLHFELADAAARLAADRSANPRRPILHIHGMGCNFRLHFEQLR